MNPIGEPDAGDRHVRFDERGWETGDWQSLKHRAHPRLYPWRPAPLTAGMGQELPPAPGSIAAQAGLGARSGSGAVRAQRQAVSVIGFLNTGTQRDVDAFLPAFHQGLRETGFIEGQNMASEYRWAEFHYDRLPALAAELVSRKVDVIVALSGTPTALEHDPVKLKHNRR